MKLDHIIIGAGRSGTTSLVAYLKQHPLINFSSIKEVTYFSIDDHYNRKIDFLHSFFDELKQGLCSTSDTYLLMDANAPKRLAEYNPNVKITVILREPSARTHSNYNYSTNHRYLDESLSLMESQKLEEAVLLKGDVIKRNNECSFYGSLYHLHLTNWLNYFSKEQIFICTMNQLKNDPQTLMNNYFDFLGLDKILIEELLPKNKSVHIKSKILNDFLVNRNHPLRRLIRKPLHNSFLRNLIFNSKLVEKIKNRNKKEHTYRELNKEEKEFCHNYFQEDLQNLQEDFGIKFD